MKLFCSGQCNRLIYQPYTEKHATTLSDLLTTFWLLCLLIWDKAIQLFVLVFPPQVLTFDILILSFLIHLRNEPHKNVYCYEENLLLYLYFTGWWDREDSVPQVHQFHDAESRALHNHEEKTNQGRLYLQSVYKYMHLCSVNCQGTPSETI